MARASAADAARTADRILQEAVKLFASRGYSHVSLDDVAQCAGVTRGAVYHHYRNKKGLFGSVAERLQTELAGAIVNAADRAMSPAEKLRAGSHAFLDTITSSGFVRILLVDAPSVVGWQEWRRVDSENSAAHLREALKSVGVSEELLDATTSQLSGAMNEAALWIAQHKDPKTARENAHTALDRLLETYTQ